MQLDVVVDDVFAEKLKELAGAVEATEIRAVDFNLGLSGEVVWVGSGEDSGKRQGPGHAADREVTVDFVIGCSLCGGGDRLRFFGDKFSDGMVGDIEEVGVVEMTNQQSVVSRVGEVLTSDAVHVETKTGGLQRIVFDFDCAGGEFDRPAVVIEEISPRPTHNTRFDIDFENAISARCGRL